MSEVFFTSSVPSVFSLCMCQGMCQCQCVCVWGVLTVLEVDVSGLIQLFSTPYVLFVCEWGGIYALGVLTPSSHLHSKHFTELSAHLPFSSFNEIMQDNLIY